MVVCWEDCAGSNGDPGSALWQRNKEAANSHKGCSHGAPRKVGLESQDPNQSSISVPNVWQEMESHWTWKMRMPAVTWLY